MFEGFSFHEVLKLSPRYLLPVAIVTGFLTLGTDHLLDSMGLKSIKSQFRPWISLFFLASTAVVVVHFLTEGSLYLRRMNEEWETMKRRRRRLHNLTPDEKRLLAGYIGRGTRSQNLNMMSGVVNGLAHEGVIYKAS